MNTIIAPSILAADFGRLAEEIKAVDQAGADWIHVDVMDGRFVPNITIGPPVVASLRKTTQLPLDVHLMIKHPEQHIDAFARAGADIINVHVEATTNLHRALQAIKALNKKAGITFNPATPIDCMTQVIDMVDLVLIMTVNPGFGGQTFIDTMLAKVSQARHIIDQSGRQIHLEVDGGVTPKTAPLVKNAGADTLVAGSAVYNTADYAAAIAALRNA
ncbi:MAG: ribulose-phosphate 3-epimerase [Deltaproteobacteria bacterium]|nr:ribulose-phosphate 3-epimerase [Deltaproteobacteria bacterium]